MMPPSTDALRSFKARFDSRARALGFDSVGVAGIEIPQDEQHLVRWLADGYHGSMGFMQRHGLMRSRPPLFKPGTCRIVSVRMNYWPREARAAEAVLGDPELAYVSRYALGRDYHRIMRPALARLAEALQEEIGPFGYRVCVDTAPVLERAYARDAGLGWIGKHTNLIAREAGSWFFLGEVLTDLPLPVDAPASAHCGTCSACLPACPTGAIVAPWRLDARRCISYLTIENAGPIPAELRPLLGNRIYGCDDCQLVCPWNRYAQSASHPDFRVRHGLDSARLTELFSWSPEQFAQTMRGSVIYRIGFERWSRNVAVALGNAPTRPGLVAALSARREDPSALVREHVQWALARHGAG